MNWPDGLIKPKPIILQTMQQYFNIYAEIICRNIKPMQDDNVILILPSSFSSLLSLSFPLIFLLLPLLFPFPSPFSSS